MNALKERNAKNVFITVFSARKKRKKDGFENKTNKIY